MKNSKDSKSRLESNYSQGLKVPKEGHPHRLERISIANRYQSTRHKDLNSIKSKIIKDKQLGHFLRIQRHIETLRIRIKSPLSHHSDTH